MEDTRLLKCVMFGEVAGGASCVRRQGKEWMRCLLDDLRAFGINADLRITPAQDEMELGKTVEQGTERLIVRWVATEKARAGLY